jgi:hypothetical protein
VQVAIGREVGGGRCRFLRSSGRLGPRVSCTRTRFLRARGTRRWSFTAPRPLPVGRYVAWVRGVDRYSNVERKAPRRNRLKFRLR